jgi:diguanylate cyclase (GGDEF)-like protein
MSTAIEDENQQLLGFLYACPIGLIEVAMDGAIGMMNPFAMQLMLPTQKTSLITNFFAVMEAYAPELRNLVDSFTAHHGTVCENHRILITPAVEQRGVEATVLACTLVKLDDQKLMATISDVSLQVAQERRLKQAEVWFSSLLDDVKSFAVLSIDAEGLIDAAQPSVFSLTGFDESQTIGRTLDMFEEPDEECGTLDVPGQIALAGREGWHLSEGWNKHSQGEPYWCQRMIAPRCNQDGSAGYTVVLRKVTRQTLDVGKLKKMLTTDHLTGACNRSHFFEIAERECSRSRRYSQSLALIAIDVDLFKKVNDTYGHSAGDEVLQSFSRICMSVIRPTDTFARLGGEEFVVLLPSTDLKRAGELAERLRSTIANTALEIIGSGSLHVTASLGCADTQGQMSTFTELLAEADKALYTAKLSGRDCVVLSNLVPVAA